MSWLSKKVPTEQYPNLPDDLDDFSCNDWITYIDQLLQNFDYEKAKEKWVKDRHREYDDPFGVTPPDCALSCDWHREIAKRGLKSDTWRDAACQIEDVWATLVDTTQSVTEATGEFAEGVGAIAKGTGSLLSNPLILLGIAAAAAWAISEFSDLNPLKQ
jgi:hypothetical protein